MAQVRSVDFLPEIFQTDANKQFLSATLDQLIQEPSFKKTQGYIGRKIGPGVNPTDRYVAEPDKTRTDYQLETGVISIDPDNVSKIKDAITYPGILDAVSFQGGNTSKPGRLFTSEYYTWDPFINFDAFINFNQYYWMPDGPPAVSVFSENIPFNQTFSVLRSNGVYTFSGQAGSNPTLDLVRGGTYTFKVDNSPKSTVNYRVSVSGTSAYLIDYAANPTLTLIRGNTYVFTLSMTAIHPFWIKTAPVTGLSDAYNNGVTNNGAHQGNVTFTVPLDAPDTLYYSAENNTNMHGTIAVVNSASGDGPGFWIQTAPGINGRNPTTPNLSTRGVLGVVNNGEDIGTVTFTVPSKTAQNYYYTLQDYGTVDLVTNLNFDQINNAGVENFINTYGGIDGITTLNGKTLVFIHNITDETNGGWNNDTVYDPLARDDANNGLSGSYDSLPYAYGVPVPENQRLEVWQISYVTSGTYTYMKLNSVSTIAKEEKFIVGYGATYSKTQWYKNNSGLFEQIPLLSAILDTLYYQDSSDPTMFGRINLVEASLQSVLNINDIIGQKTYTSPSNSYYPDGVTFTNGLKVKFIGNVEPRTYWSGTIVLNCYSTVPGINIINCDSTQGLYPGQTVTFTDPIGGLEPNTTYYILKVFSTSQFTVSVIEDGAPVTLIESYGEMVGTVIANNEYYVAGVGTAIELLPVENFLVVEPYSNDANTETVLIEPSDLDYITIDRASKDLNAWTRSNRWFHSQVIAATGTYNKNPINTALYQKASRPIIEFEPGLRLYNMGSQGKRPVNVIDFTETDAFSNIEGATEYTVFTTPVQNILPSNLVVGTPYKITRLGTTDWNAVAGTVGVTYAVDDTFVAVAKGSGTGAATPGYTVANNTRIIFAADSDPLVRDKIYVVNFVVPDSTPATVAGDFKYSARYTIVSLGDTDWNAVANTSGVVYQAGDTIRAYTAGSGTGTARFAEPIINLVPAADGTVEANQSTLCLNGSQQGLTYWYDGLEWIQAQQKTSTQQAPLFNIYNAAGVSLDDPVVYPNSTFQGTKLFSYAIGPGAIDPVLNFPLKYRSINNVGDILFDNNLYVDQFTYVISNTNYTEKISIGCPRQYVDRTNYERLLGWQTAVVPTFQRQQFKFTYDTKPLLLDVKVLSDQETIIPAVKVYVGSVFQHPDTYTVTTSDSTTTITFGYPHVLGEIVEVSVLSDQISAQGFYQTPMNLGQNPLNKNSDDFTLGTIRTHYETICENLTSLMGPINGANNTRDLGNIVPYGQLILQQSSPLTLAGYFMRSENYNIFAALEYNSREYQKYKNQLLEAVTKQTIDYNTTTASLLDAVIVEVVKGRTSQNPFYWSDMLPGTETFTTTTYTLSCISTPTFDTNHVYNYSSANYYGMNVYYNNRLLVRGVEYIVGENSATITLLPPLSDTIQDNDVLVLQEYTETYGTFCPNTPTKLGLYPAWVPQITEVKTSRGVATVIVGHDGSQTPIFDDIRDQVLLEFETRIYNNLKLNNNPVPLTLTDVLPGQFRNTGYSYQEINGIFAQSLLTYVGWNKLDYTAQNYDGANPFTFNYSSCLNKLTDTNLLGAWRGINRYFYDTQQPEITPWEMLGFTIKPDWWEPFYGPAPYTADNLVLWDDLEAGLVRDPAGEYIIPKYVRPGLTQVIPTGTEGELLAPLYSVVGVQGQNTFRKSWVAGDGGPVEASWWNSSDYPFAVMRLLALTRPAEFFSLFADRDLYKFNEEFQQYLYKDRYRFDATEMTIYGTGTSKASFINWIVDYNKILGQESTVDLQNNLANLDVRLCYRMASFSDKQYISLYTERVSPGSTNSSFLIPDESYNLLLYKNQPFGRSIYSSVVIQTVETGWAVYGYSSARPYFNTFTSLPTGQFKTFTVGFRSLQVPVFYSDTITSIPYGYVFQTQEAVANFLMTYGAYLEHQGFTFTDRANGYTLDWSQMVQEFMYWVDQGWGPGSLINLNPLADKLEVTKEKAVVDSINAQTVENVVLDQNKQEFSTRNLNIVRLDNTFTLQSLNDQTISFVDLRYTSYESMIVLDNSSLFGDLIYDPVTGSRQSRLKIVATTTTDWNGTVDAPGFIRNQDNVPEWTGLKIYAKGELVKYKNKYWSAATIVQPSTVFDYNSWNQSDYTQIETGLLPNIANKANQLNNSYSINNANLELDNDLLSYGLIGFRPRQYMTLLGLDGVSQVNVYRQFLDTKGTILSADLLTNADFGKEAADYQIYENWALQHSVYGANANRKFFDLRLNKAYLTSDPALVQVVLLGEQSKADQKILLSDVWKSSFVLTTPNILPTTTTTVTDIGLPTAGYVNIDDVDVTVFQLSDPANLSANIDSIKNGTVVWVAKVNDYDWNIYRTQNIDGEIQHVCDNLDGTSRVIFSKPHGLTVGNQLIIKFFDVAVNGIYKVLGVPDINTVNIAFTFDSGRTVANGNGIGLKLQTMRVAQASDVSTLSYAKQILPGARVWVDDNGNGLWEVLEKQDPFKVTEEVRPISVTANEQYGSSVAQNADHSNMLVGSPYYDSNAGGVYVYVDAGTTQFDPAPPVPGVDQIVQLNATGVVGFGNAVDFGNNDWAVVGASQSQGPNSETNNGYVAVLRRNIDTINNLFPVWQVLTLPGTTNTTTPGAGEFGAAVAMSANERWLYVGAPGLNLVYAYGLVDAGAQVFETTTTESTTSVDISGYVQINNIDQISVTVDNVLLTPVTDYTVSVDFTTVDFVAPVATGNAIKVERNTLKSFAGGSASYNLTDYFFTISNIYSFTVTVDGQVQRPAIDYTYSAGNLVFYSAPSGMSTVRVSAAEYWQYVDTLTVAGLPGNAGFGSAIQCSTDGRQVIVGTPNDMVYGTIVTDTGGISSTGLAAAGFKVFNGVSAYSTTGVGTNAKFNVTRYNNAYIVTVANSGSNYAVNDQIVILGSTLGGVDAINDLTITVKAVTSITEAGSVYVFDRNVQAFVVSNATVNTYTALGTLYAPVSVSVNNEFLTNEEVGVVGGNNTFTISGNTVTVNTTLEVGDVIEIETNQFVLEQKVVENQVTEFVNFGQAVELCPYNCSLYVGAPQDNTTAWKGGIVQRNVAVARSFGTITSTLAVGSLTVGDTLRVNNIDVVVPVAGTVASLATAINTTVPNASAEINSRGFLVISAINPDSQFGNKLQVAPGTIGTVYADLGFETFAYTQTIESPLAADYAAFGSTLSVNESALELVVGAPKGTLYLANTFDYIPNSEKPPTIFDGNSTTFYSPVVQGGVVYTYDYLASSSNTLSNPGKFTFGQQIGNNLVKVNDRFGQSLSYDAGLLIVGAPSSDPIQQVGTFEIGTSYTIVSTGNVQNETNFKLIGAANNNPGTTFIATGSGTFTAGQFIVGENYTIKTRGNTNFVAIGAPNNDVGTSFIALAVGSGTGTAVQGTGTAVLTNLNNIGATFVFDNPSKSPAWKVIHKQKPVVDIRLINSIYMYDRLTSARTEFFDFFDPLQGKILGAAQQNLDYVGAVDPAAYNVGAVNNRGNTWGSSHVGEMWWDISTVRFLDTNQDDIVYASRRWGQLFPGSTVDVYQWVSSTVPPASYAGSGTPRDINSYVIETKLNNNGLFGTNYYFWVKNVVTTYTQQGKTLSASVVAQYIESPKASGISYVAPLNASTIAIYNGLQYINAADTIISIDFDQTYNDSNVHVEYELIAQGRPSAFMSDLLYAKFQDSLAGENTQGDPVPDPNLPVSEQYGVQFRPRQSMFVNRLLALQNYITKANSVLKLYPISETRNFSLLNSSEPIPAPNTGAWDFACATLEILSYQDIYAVPVGYIYLVESDADQGGRWATYTVAVSATDPAVRVLNLTRVQSYKTNDYWTYIDWYLPGYNSTTKISYEVPNYVNLKYLNAIVGATAKVTANPQGKWEIYLYTDVGWERVGLQDGTIAISSTLYVYPTNLVVFNPPLIETRKIVQAINEELFIDELLIERNRAMTLMFNFILSEQQAPEWLVKTSLIDVDHTVRKLLPYPNYVIDNQDFVTDYLQEVKPYHVQLREFNLKYSGADEYFGDVTDFDVPAYYNADLTIPQYVSPILLPYAHSTPQPFNTLSDTPLSSIVWSEWPYSQWIENYTLTVDSIKVINGGSGYTELPIITVVGACVTPATAIAVIDGLGTLVEIIVTDHGAGYTQTPIIQIESALGSGATAYPIMTNGLVRSFKTIIKYDRCEFNSTIFAWKANVVYEIGHRVRFADAVWSAKGLVQTTTAFVPAEWTANPGQSVVGVPDWQVNVQYINGQQIVYSGMVYTGSGTGPIVSAIFNLDEWAVVPAGELNAADRTMGYYAPGVNMPGLDLPLLIDGISYPGVQVYGPGFTEHQEQIVLTITETIGVPPNSNLAAPLNIIVCNSTAGLVPGMQISFSGTLFGNLTDDHLFYVFEVVDTNKFTVSYNNRDKEQYEFTLYSSAWAQVSIDTWNISNAYEINDVVYAPDGSIRQALKKIVAGTNISIDNTLYWNETPIAYVQGSVVTYQGNYYSAKQNVPPSIDITDTIYWEEIADPVAATGTVIIPTALDAIYASYFGVRDPANPGEYLVEPDPPYPSERITDINVEGGWFVDVYEGHAPEELMNGSEYDTMDFRVYTTTGSDWSGDGHGFSFNSVRFSYLEDEVNPNYSWAGLVNYPCQVEVSNVTTKILLLPGVDYDINWTDQTLFITNGVSYNDVLEITVYQSGGGNQRYQTYLTGQETGDTVIVPVESSLIYNIVVFVNGVSTTINSWTPYYSNATDWNITQGYAYNDVVYSQVFGTGAISGITLTVTSISSGTITYGTEITGAGIAAGTRVVAVINNQGSVTTYQVNISQTVASTAFSGQTIYYRAIVDVPPGIDLNNYEYWQSSILDPAIPAPYDHEFYGPRRNSAFELPAGITVTDGVLVLVQGYTEPTQYNWSVPITEYIVADATIVSTRTLYPTNSLQGTNPANLAVTRNGLRLTPPGGREWTGDGTTTEFELPQRIGPQTGILDADVQVWVNNVLVEQPTDYIVVGTTVKSVQFTTAPAEGDDILISVSTYADYTVNLGPTPTIVLAPLPNVGDVFGITTFNDTAQQDILTVVFNGPVQTGYTDVEPYSSTDYSPLPEGPEWDIAQSYDIYDVVFTQVYSAPGVPAPGNLPVFYKALQDVPPGVDISNTAYWEVIDLYDLPLSYDYSQGYQKDSNQFNLGRTITNTGRLWVTLDGNVLFDGIDFTVVGQYLMLGSGTISPGQILVVTEFTDSIMPNAMAFRIFQDMRGVQATYRITPSTTTTVARPVLSTDNIIYVTNIQELSEPNLPNGVFGVVTINGERIMYRERDVIRGVIRGLFRGTAGTGAADHDVGAEIYDMGRGNLLMEYYQDYADEKIYAAVGPNNPDRTAGQTEFTATIEELELSYFPLEAFDTVPYDYAGIYVDIGSDEWVRSAASNAFNGKPGSYDYGQDPQNSVLVYVGGVRVLEGYTIQYDPNPDPAPNIITVIFDVAPPDSQEVTFVVLHGRTWYTPGGGNPSNGVALQETDNPAARFLRGLT